MISLYYVCHFNLFYKHSLCVYSIPGSLHTFEKLCNCHVVILNATSLLPFPLTLKVFNIIGYPVLLDSLTLHANNCPPKSLLAHLSLLCWFILLHVFSGCSPGMSMRISYFQLCSLSEWLSQSHGIKHQSLLLTFTLQLRHDLSQEIQTYIANGQVDIST